jgi:PAS domain S-box-containing protein
LRSRLPALVTDTSKDDRWLHRPDDEAEQSGPKSAICIPLVSRDQITGILTIVHPEPGFFNKDHLALLQSIADQAGIAVFNARLYDSLQSATRRYRELFEDSIDPILITDRHGHIIEANRRAARITGFQRHDLLGLSIFDLHAANMVRLGEDFANLTNGQTVTYESNLRTHTDAGIRDAHLPVEVYVREVLIGTDLSLQWTLHDLTERKALDALHEDLSAMIYHDLRSPLANIVSSLDMLATLMPMESGDAALQSVFSIAVRSTERMQRLISSLLDINRLEAGQPIANQQVTNAADLLSDAVDAIRPVIESKQQSVEIKIAADFPRIRVDADMIRRVLINLLENATKFTPMEGKIQVGGERQGSGVRLWVKDSGAGIPAEATEHIFDKFIRLQAERVPKGVGLGLAFCRLAVQAHGGKIWVESQPGAGSCFIFTLPSSI